MLKFYNAKLNENILMIWLGGDIPSMYVPTILLIGAIAQRSNYNFTLLVDKHINFYRAVVKFTITKNLLAYINLLTCDYLLIQLKNSDFFSGTAENDLRYNNFVKFCLCEGVGLKNLAAKVDWLRYVWLEQHGGIYLDMDTEICTNLYAKPFVFQKNISLLYGIMLHEGYTYDCRKGVNGNRYRRYKRVKFTANDIIACAASHQLMRALINKMIDRSKRFLYFNSFIQLVMSESSDNMDRESASLKKIGKSLFDKKRVPSVFSNFGNMLFAKACRSELTLILSGPVMLGEMLCAWLQTEAVNLSRRVEYIGFKCEDEELNILGVNVVSHSHLNWCQQESPPSSVECNF